MDGRDVVRPYIDEVVEIRQQKKEADVWIEDLQKVVSYSTKANAEVLAARRRHAETLMEERQASEEEQDQMEYVILKHGERVAGRLSNALKADKRFLFLNGQWFVRDKNLLTIPSAAQMRSIAWNCFVVPSHFLQTSCSRWLTHRYEIRTQTCSVFIWLCEGCHGSSDKLIQANGRNGNWLDRHQENAKHGMLPTIPVHTKSYP